jgi:hypothetical protein
VRHGSIGNIKPLFTRHPLRRFPVPRATGTMPRRCGCRPHGCRRERTGRVPGRIRILNALFLLRHRVPPPAPARPPGRPRAARSGLSGGQTAFSTACCRQRLAGHLPAWASVGIPQKAAMASLPIADKQALSERPSCRKLPLINIPPTFPVLLSRKITGYC